MRKRNLKKEQTAEGRKPPPLGPGRRPERSRRKRPGSRRSAARTRRSRHGRWRRVHGGAQSALRKYRQATALAVALTALLLLVGGTTPGDLAPATAPQAAETDPTEPDPQRSLEEATSTVRGLLKGLVSLLPKIGVALLLLLLAWLLSVLLRMLLHRFLKGWEKSEAISALVRIALFLLAIGAGLSVIVGDATALVGSVGLVGLALSWALQTPIESFTGWVLNAMRGYYRPGDRIEVGDVFGDVYRIDVLTTTLWEAGGPGKAVTGSQPTGALVTFPNWEILRSNIINYSRDFPYVWDEVTVAVANESDLGYTVDVFRKAADAVVGDMMREPSVQYRQLLERQRLAYGVEEKPQVYLSPADAWTNCTVRYLVPLRERRRWSTQLIVALSVETARPEHRGRIIAGYPRTQVDLLDERAPSK